jgi:RNA polymerase sigma-70 factor (ECF subfamily)
VEHTEREAQWAQWMRAAAAGDKVAYRSLLAALAPFLRRAVRQRFARIGCGDVDVEDVVQETLLAIHLKRQTWRPVDPVTPWVVAISRNKTIDVLRRRGRRAELPLDDVPEPLAEEVAADGAGHDLALMLDSLDERQRRIVQLVSIEGHSSRAAAESLGISEGALRVALHRSLKALAARWREAGK